MSKVGKGWAYYAVYRESSHDEMIGVTETSYWEAPSETTIIYPKYPPIPPQAGGPRCLWIGKLITKVEFETYIAFGIDYIVDVGGRTL